MHVNLYYKFIVSSEMLGSEDPYDRDGDQFHMDVKYRHPSISQSERVLKDYSAPFDDRSQTIEEIKETRKKLHKELLAARGAKDWKDFVNQSYKYTPHTEEGKKIRFERFLMVTNAIDAFDEIPNVPMYDSDDPKKGRHFLRNDWFMGPFYSYDHNYLNK